jgi:hypothetical protein
MISYATLKRFVLTIVIIFVVIGCSSDGVKPSSTPVTREKMVLVRYEMPYQEVANILNHPGKPMFRFTTDNNTYYIALYRPSYQYSSYLFLYENGKLASILTAQKGMELWEKEFGLYGQTLPKNEKIKAVVDTFKKNRELIRDYSFYEARGGKIKSETEKTGALMIEAGTVYMWIPGAFQLLAGTGIAVITADSITNETRDSKLEVMPVNIKSQSYYDQVIEKYKIIKMGSSYDEVVSNLGDPSYNHANKEQGVMVYKDEEYVVFGFIDDKLHWMAFDYPLTVKQQ